jgi:hypothetical protein
MLYIDMLSRSWRNAWMLLIFLFPGSSALAQTWADEKAQEALLASTWKGEIRGIPFAAYLLDEGLIVMAAGDQEPRTGRWFFYGGKFGTSARLAEDVNVGLRAEIHGDAMVGTSILTGQDLPFELRRQAQPDSRLLAVAPPGRPNPPPPPASAADFYGSYEVELPERIGQASPRVKATLTCEQEACLFSMGKDVSEAYDLLEPIRRSNFSQARFALKYAKDRKDAAKEEAPYLSALLSSDANIHSCINLGYKKPRFSGADVPGLTILCKLDRNPWSKPVVLHMGSILANCGKAFCRYAIIPMFRRE